MTQHASSPGLASFNFTSASGTVWNLTTLRPLSPSVRLVRAADGAIYALKLLPVSGEKTRLLLTREAETWKKASQCPAVLKLHDVYFNTDTAFFIMEYCAGSILTAPRAERSALRAIAAVASALQFVIDSAEQRAHASLSLDHILFDSTGSLKLGGFGLTRAKRVASTKRNLSERNDIRALTALLYELCYGKRFDSANPAIPDAPQITGLTKDLLRSVLFVPMAKVPDLLVYRYDLAAARKLVPSCTPPLKPIVNTRPQENLELDIDSSRGLPPSSVVTDNQSTLPIEANTSPPSVTASHSASNTVEAERDNGFSDLHSLAGVNEAVRRIATPTLVPEGNNEVNRLLEACLPMQQLPDRIFEALGQLHISSSKGNPVVAFKVATLIHRLLAEGPATLTSSALQKLDFLKWIETSWSRTRISNHGGRVHAYTYCFAAGEISWYAAMLRCRAFVHGTFAKVFSTHWLARGNGLPTLQANRRDAFRSILDILERCGALVRKVATSKDPAANIKQFAIPLLIQEICKTYYALCWLFATAPMNMKTLLECELGVAHTAARNANNIVHSAPDVAAQCAPEFLLTLEETVPDQLDPEALVSLLKKLKRKKKKKKSSAAAVNLSKSKRVENSQDEEVLAESETGLPEDSETKSPLTTPEEAKDKRREISPPTEVTQRKKVPNTRKAFRQPPVVPLDDIEQLPNSQPQNALQPIRKSSPDISSLRKLSISVRKGLPSDGQEPVQNGYKMPHDKYKAVDGRQIRSRSRSRSPLRRSALSGSEDDSEQDGSDSLSESSDASSDVQGSGGEGTYVKQITNRKQDRKGRAKKKSNKKRKNDSESGSEDEEPRRKPKGKKKGKAKRKSKDENIEDTSADPSAKEKRVGRKKHANEKAIPFDKKPPKRKTWAKPQGNDEEYEGGSKEALAAAASGKKTPSMNLKFEVAPYEVQFAQQIGSGGFGVVFKAKFRGETVAVKKIHAHALMNSASIVEFQSEVAVLCTLRHPNIIGFVGACTRPPNLMIITEFMERGTLFDVLHQSNERVTWPMRKKFALDTCKGMRYLHDSKLLHRDLKSSNLLLDKDYNCKVGDFGLTRISKGSAAVQMTGQCGTFQYMAVEVLANKPYSEKADVFSFGILLWEIVARKLPYFGMQPMQVGMAVLNQGLRPTIPRECPPSLAKLMRNCWDSDPSQRPSFRELVPILEALPE